MVTACPVCKSQDPQLWSKSRDWEYSSTEEIYDFLHCTNCDTIYIDPMPVDQLEVIYPHNYYSFVSQKKSLPVRLKEYLDKRLFKKLLEQIKGDELNVLDIGGGTGWLLDMIKQIDPRIKITQVVDIDEKAKAAAIGKGHQYFHGRVEEYQTDTKFDLILMLNLIEHVESPAAVMHRIQGILNQEGLVLMKTPNIDSWDARLFQHSYWGGLHCPRHWVLFSENSFRYLLSGTDLKIKTLKYTQGAPFWAYSVMAWLAKRGIVKLSKEQAIIYHPLFMPLGAFFAGFDFVRGLFFRTSQMFIILSK